MKYKLSDLKAINTGYILKVLESVIDYNSPCKAWNNRIIDVNQFYYVIDIDNQGRITAIDKHNRIHYLHALQDGIKAIYKPLAD